MTAEIGQLALTLALALSIVMAATGLAGARVTANVSRRIASSAAPAGWRPGSRGRGRISVGAMVGGRTG